MAPLQITQAQWAKLTPQQQHAYLQRMSMQRQQYQQQQQQQQQQQHQVQPQQQAAAAQAPRRPTNINQGISFGALMPLLQPHLPPEQASRLSALYQRFKVKFLAPYDNGIYLTRGIFIQMCFDLNCIPD